MNTRRISWLDRCLSELDTALYTVGAPARARRPSPAGAGRDRDLTDRQRRESAGLMRVNHAGEVAAQALYRGQALVARNDELRTALLAAADEEYEHLAWCQNRVQELGQGTSVLGPVWYAGSFTIGAAAGLLGDAYSLGFLAETEDQVEAHLSRHLEKLPGSDVRSRRILERMREEEISHRDAARERGGAELPPFATKLMRATARIMTSVSRHI